MFKRCNNPNNESKRRKYRAFTLVELLIVMSILMILSTISISSFSGLRRSIVVNETVTNFQQVIRNTQKSAMLLSRSANQKWMYGTGVDLSHIEEDGYYKTFKWCSPFNIYGENYNAISYQYATSKFPAYDPNYDLAIVGGDSENGLLPIGRLSEYVSCNQSEVYDQGGGFAILEDGISKQIRSPLKATIKDESGVAGGTNKIAFIVFESISGRTFFYNEDGLIINYDDNGDMLSEPENLQIEFTTDETQVKHIITVKNVSGKVSYTSLSPEQQ